MKKFLLTLLVVFTGIVNANADGEMWLRSDLNGGSWADNLSNFQFSKTWDATNSQDIYELTISSSMLKDDTDFYFRLFRNGNNYETCPYNNTTYVYAFANGQNETYGATSASEFQGTNSAFGVAHKDIKANSYKITVYVKYNSPWEYYIKVEIMDMPVTVGESGFATLVSDRALNFANSGITAYTAADAGSGNATLTAITQPAKDTPMLLKKAANENNTTFSIPVVEYEYGSANPSNNAFKQGPGTTLASATGNYKNYILNSGAFYLANGQNVATNKAYLQLVSTASKATLIFPDGDATSIDAISGENTDGVYYNLQGMKVANPTKGLYILNGKKYIVK